MCVPAWKRPNDTNCQAYVNNLVFTHLIQRHLLTASPRAELVAPTHREANKGSDLTASLLTLDVFSSTTQKKTRL